MEVFAFSSVSKVVVTSDAICREWRSGGRNLGLARLLVIGGNRSWTVTAQNSGGQEDHYEKLTIHERVSFIARGCKKQEEAVLAKLYDCLNANAIS